MLYGLLALGIGRELHSDAAPKIVKVGGVISPDLTAASASGGDAGPDLGAPKYPATAAPAEGLNKVSMENKPKILLVSTMFGEQPWKEPLLPLFLWSVAKAPDVEVILFGSPAELPEGVELPSNVRRVMKTIPEAVADVSSFIGKDLDATWKTVANATDAEAYGEGAKIDVPYKLGCEMRPLIPAMYPEMTKGYDWVGWVDNDMVLGGEAFAKLRASIDKCSAAVLPLYGEEVSPVRNPRGDIPRMKWSNGPLTIMNAQAYRDHIAPHLKKQANQLLLQDVFALPTGTRFDEWGRDSHEKAEECYLAKYTTEKKWWADADSSYRHSFSGMLFALSQEDERFLMPSVDEACPQGGLRLHYQGTQPDDGLCKECMTENEEVPINTPENPEDVHCHLDGSGSIGKLDGNLGYSALFSHLHHRKKISPERFSDMHAKIRDGSASSVDL